MEFIKLLAGLSIFLTALSQMEKSINKASGKSFEIMLARFTQNHFTSVLTGIISTAILQSSSVVTLMILAFVGANLLPLSNALGVVIGANLGTTFTGWIVSTFGFKMDLGKLIFPLLSLGAISYFLGSKLKRLQHILTALFSFGLLLYGLDLMKESMGFISTSIDINSLKSLSIFFYFLFGIVVTALIQSSSAMMMITLTALNQGIVGIEGACALVIGADLGTTGTTILGAIGGSLGKKRIAAAHVVFNLITDIVALIFIFPLIKLAKMIIGADDPLYLLVFFHSTFNLIGLIVFFPFLTRFQNFLERIFPEKEKKKLFDFDTTYVSSTHVEVLKNALSLTSKLLEKYLLDDRAEKLELYSQIKENADEMFAFILALKRSTLTDEEFKQVARLNEGLMELLNSLKDSQSVSHNMIDFADHVDPFIKEFYKRQMTIIEKIVQTDTSDFRSLELEIEASREDCEDFIIEQKSKTQNFKGLASLMNVNRENHTGLKSYIKLQASILN